MRTDSLEARNRRDVVPAQERARDGSFALTESVQVEIRCLGWHFGDRHAEALELRCEALQLPLK